MNNNSLSSRPLYFVGGIIYIGNNRFENIQRHTSERQSAQCNGHTQQKNLTNLLLMIFFFSHLSIDFEIARGQLVAVVGHVGSGKSSLIGSLLGESTKLNGRVVVNVRGRFVYFFLLCFYFVFFHTVWSQKLMNVEMNS